MIPGKITTEKTLYISGWQLKTKRGNIIPHLTRPVYCNVNKMGNKIWNAFYDTNCKACTREEWLITRFIIEGTVL